MKRISIIGISGSGKSTIGRRLGSILGLDYVELDAMFWGPNWQEPEIETFREQVSKVAEGEAWVVDGNYSRHVRDLIWARADTVVWLDYPFWLSFSMLVKRSFIRAARREELWHGNRETIRNLVSRDSLLWYVIRNRRRIKRKNALDLAAHPHLAVHRFERPGEANTWLESL